MSANLNRPVPGPVVLAERAVMPASLPKMLGLSATLIAAGLFPVLVALRGEGLVFGAAALPLYCLGLVFISMLTWWESTRRRVGTLPSWTSPPALIAGWSLVWVYLPSLSVFLDDNLLDDFTLAQGGDVVLVTGLPLTCVALATLSLAYHATAMALGRHTPPVERAEVPVALRRAVGLYLISTAARTLRLRTLGVAYGADLASWGPLQSVDQWIGYAEDLRFLALALLVAHVMRRHAGHFWLGIALLIELVMSVSSGFLMPVILPVVLCAATAAVFDRVRKRHVVLLAAGGLVVATFVPVIAAIRQDRIGGVGTADLATAGDAITAPVKYWLNGVSSGEGAYEKFFGRQAEAATATGLVVTLTPAVIPYEGLEQFLALPAGLIPRALWPGKPTLSRGVWFSVAFRGFEEGTTSYSAMTIFSEGYLFYGWTGTVLAMLIAGAVLGVVNRCLDNPSLALVYLALVPTVLHIEPEFSSYLITLIQRSLVFVVVFVLLMHTRTRRLEKERIRP